MAEKLTEISEGKEKAEGLVKDSKSKSSEMEESFLTKFRIHNYNHCIRKVFCHSQVKIPVKKVIM